MIILFIILALVLWQAIEHDERKRRRLADSQAFDRLCETTPGCMALHSDPKAIERHYEAKKAAMNLKIEEHLAFAKSDEFKRLPIELRQRYANEAICDVNPNELHNLSTPHA